MIGYDRRLVTDKYKEEKEDDNAEVMYAFYAIAGLVIVVLILIGM